MMAANLRPVLFEQRVQLSAAGLGDLDQFVHVGVVRGRKASPK